MKRRSSVRSFSSFGTIRGGLLAVILAILVPALGYSADRLVVQDTGGGTAFVVTENGRIGVGLSTPEQDLDIVAPNNGLIRLSSTTTDNTTKASRMVVRHYSNAEEPVYLFGAASTSTNNFVAFGGGSPLGNAATQLDLFTAPNPTTPVGSPRITIKGNGYVGIGTQTPSYPLQMAGGAYSDGASWIDGSSREYKDNIRDLTTEEAMSAFQGLNPVAFNYKSGAGEEHIGFIAEDVPELVATKDRKGLSPMDIVAVLTKVVQEKSQLIEKLERMVEAMEKRLSSLEK